MRRRLARSRRRPAVGMARHCPSPRRRNHGLECRRASPRSAPVAARGSPSITAESPRAEPRSQWTTLTSPTSSSRLAGRSGFGLAASIPAASIAASPAEARVVPRTAQPSAEQPHAEQPPPTAATDDQRTSHRALRRPCGARRCVALGVGSARPGSTANVARLKLNAALRACRNHVEDLATVGRGRSPAAGRRSPPCSGRPSSCRASKTGCSVLALLGQAVFKALGMLAVETPFYDSLLDQGSQALA